jgi:hypothetical protein
MMLFIVIHGIHDSNLLFEEFNFFFCIDNLLVNITDKGFCVLGIGKKSNVVVKQCKVRFHLFELLLLVGVLASAAYRMRLYQVAYGLTEQRLYGSVFMVWLVGVLGVLVATVLRGRRRGFAFAAIVDGLACIAVLHILNPHALIARVNISRAASGAEIDAGYLRTLSADAVPTLMAKLPALPPVERVRTTNETSLLEKASMSVACEFIQLVSIVRSARWWFRSKLPTR